VSQQFRIRDVNNEQQFEIRTIGSIQAHNIKVYEQCGYRGQSTGDRLRANFRYELLPSDFTGIYRAHHKSYGIDTLQKPERNINVWLDPQHLEFKPTLVNCIFYYSPRCEQSKCFVVCIATPDMEEASWAHVHGSQLILDGTFGLSLSCLLMWIAMGVDSEGKGVPVMIFLFSAPTGNRATHAGYDTSILSRLLQQWCVYLSARPSAQGRTFEPAVAITDTDTKERAALTKTWPSIQLLLCKFHVHQCWTNKRTTLLGKGGSDEFWQMHV